MFDYLSAFVFFSKHSLSSSCEVDTRPYAVPFFEDPIVFGINQIKMSIDNESQASWYVYEQGVTEPRKGNSHPLIGTAGNILEKDWH